MGRKNRVWKFFPSPLQTRSAKPTATQQPRRENRPTLTKPASGILYWPSRDPIEEKGGVNLYGMVGNDGICWFDKLGKEPGGPGYGSLPVPDFSPPRPQTSISSLSQAIERYSSNAGGTLQATDAVDMEIISTTDYFSFTKNYMPSLWQGTISLGPCSQRSGYFNRDGGTKSIWTGTQTVGTVTITVTPYVVVWFATELDEKCERHVHASAKFDISYTDEFNYVYDPKSKIKTIFTDVIPSWINGPGTAFTITGSFSDHTDYYFTQNCKRGGGASGSW